MKIAVIKAKYLDKYFIVQDDGKAGSRWCESVSDAFQSIKQRKTNSVDFIHSIFGVIRVEKPEQFTLENLKKVNSVKGYQLHDFIDLSEQPEYLL